MCVNLLVSIYKLQASIKLWYLRWRSFRIFFYQYMGNVWVYKYNINQRDGAINPI